MAIKKLKEEIEQLKRNSSEVKEFHARYKELMKILHDIRKFGDYISLSPRS